MRGSENKFQKIYQVYTISYLLSQLISCSLLSRMQAINFKQSKVARRIGDARTVKIVPELLHYGF
jgi:hypothetical protein